jgi:NTE family protein
MLKFISPKKFLIIILVLTLTSCAAPRPFLNIPSQPPPLPQRPPPRVAVVLGSGGTRSLAEIGVLKVLERHHIPVDLIVGTSSGSIVGVIYADRANTFSLQRTLINAQRSDLIDISALHALQGPITGNALQNFILTHVRAMDFRQLKIRFVAVATDLITGATVPLASGPLAPAINASSAIPPYFHPVNLYGHIFIDGSTTDPIAVDIAKTYNPKVIIAVNTAPDISSLTPTNLVSIYDRTYFISDIQFNAHSAEGADVIIHPRVGETDIFDATQKLALIHAGERAARKALPQICAALQKNYIASDCSTSVRPVKKENLGEKIKKIISENL